MLVPSLSWALLSWDKVLVLCNELGILVNHEKLHLIPFQEAVYLRMRLNSVTLMAFPTRERVQTATGVVGVLISSPSVCSGMETSVRSCVIFDSDHCGSLALPEVP